MCAPVVQVVARILSSFAEAIPLLSATSHPTLNEAVPVYNYVFNDIEDFLGLYRSSPSGQEKAAIIDACGPANGNVLRCALMAAHDKLRAYYSETWAAMYEIALVLDPRLRTAYFKANGWEESLVTRARNAVLRAMQAYAATEVPPSDSPSDIEARLGRIRGHIFGGVREAQPREVTELDHYLAGSVADANTDILKWWSQHASTYPRLARVARDYLAIPASSVPAERVFSGGSDMITHKQGPLHEHTIQDCVCLDSWM